MPLLVARALEIPYGVNAQSFDALDWPIELIYKDLFADAAIEISNNYNCSKGKIQKAMKHLEVLSSGVISEIKTGWKF